MHYLGIGKLSCYHSIRTNCSIFLLIVFPFFSSLTLMMPSQAAFRLLSGGSHFSLTCFNLLYFHSLSFMTFIFWISPGLFFKRNFLILDLPNIFSWFYLGYVFLQEHYYLMLSLLEVHFVYLHLKSDISFHNQFKVPLISPLNNYFFLL